MLEENVLKMLIRIVDDHSFVFLLKPWSLHMLSEIKQPYVFNFFFPLVKKLKNLGNVSYTQTLSKLFGFIVEVVIFLIL